MQVDILGGLTQNIFAYDAMQNRVKKRKVVSGTDISTFYIRDAQGNVLAVYEKNGTTVTWKEQHLYGSSRLGTVEPGVAWTSAPAATPHFRGTRILNYGWKRYEVNDHLGNVRALINDRKTYGGATFTATLLDATDYFPFGAEMRKGTVTNSYRYGFNGKELDKNNEFGSLNHYDYGFRIYNPGIGRFLSVDPLTQKYPELTPYQFASNTPIMAIDLDGLERRINIYQTDKNGNTTLTIFDNKSLLKAVSTNGGYFKFEKISRDQYQSLAQGYWGTYKAQQSEGHFFEPSGYNQYRNATTLYRGQRNEQYNPNSNMGALSVAVTPNNGAILNYTPKVAGEFTTEVNPAIYWKAASVFNPLFPNPDPMVERSGAYSTGVGLYKSMVALPFSATAAIPSAGTPLWINAAAGLSALNGVDDFTTLGTQNGSTVIQNNTPLGLGTYVKTGLNLIGTIGSVRDPNNATEGLKAILPNTISGTLDANSFFQNLINIQKANNEKKH